MTITHLAPPLTPLKRIDQALREDGFAVVSAQTVAEFSQVDLVSLQVLQKFWENLPRDPYLKDGGRYRFRRHASYQIKGENLSLVPHRAHWQSLNYNALHGGIERWFASHVILNIASTISSTKISVFILFCRDLTKALTRSSLTIS